MLGRKQISTARRYSPMNVEDLGEKEDSEKVNTGKYEDRVVTESTTPKKLTFRFYIICYNFFLAFSLLFATLYFEELLCIYKASEMEVPTTSNSPKSLIKENHELKWDNIRHIIQIGYGRTATTFQFDTLCVMLIVKFPEESVDCGFQRWKSEKRFLVTKTHHPDGKIQKFRGREDTVIFATQDMRGVSDEFNYVYVADISLVKKRAQSMVYEYQPFFNLNETQMELVADYMWYWDILRTCCGRQMSRSWRSAIRNTDSSGHKCSVYDISQVETLYMETNIFSMMRDRGMRSMLRPSEIDMDLTGSYCQTYNEGVRYCGWKHNGPGHAVPHKFSCNKIPKAFHASVSSNFSREET